MPWEEKVTIAGLPYFFNSETEEITWDKPEALMSEEEKEEEHGNWVWIPHPTQLWQPARVISKTDKGSHICQNREGKKIEIPQDGIVSGELTGGRKMTVAFWGLKLSQLNRPEEDLVQMEKVNDASIINNIRIRYEKDELYTWVGAARSVLISVNPYKTLNLYGADKVDLYRNKPPNTHLKPHVFDIANDSFNSMLFEARDQSILISGESGAGKTVCTKQCLDFLAQVAGTEQSMIEEKILKANPLLEAFGNAQTIRNNNSSRFGKWIEVHFDHMQRKISSAKITNYLLEKSRLVHQQKGERNYHIFYQMTKNSEMQSKYGLKGPESYSYTNQTGVYDAHLIDDAKEFAEVNEALQLLNFSPEEKEFVLATAAGILTLGNCEFNPKGEANGVNGSEVKDKAPMIAAAKLLGITEADLEKVLNYRSITVRGKTNVIPLDPVKAKSAKDSLSMGIYSRLFDFLVTKINQSLDGKRGKFIGILDIFGFEIFDQNSFEQLCINFANEKLQQQFNRTTFKEEEELYQKEGINFKHIEFIDSQKVLDMIEKPPQGILPLLDDECKLPEGANKKFMKKMEDNHSASDKYQTDTHRKLQDSFNFEIVHYAGVVKYNGENFMLKNTDNLFQDMYDLCSTNSNPIFAAMFPKSDFRQMKSLSYQFRTQLDNLMESLYNTDSRYIRCLKPNGLQKPNAFDSFLVIDQLRYSGVFEAVDIRKQGYPFRKKFAQFTCRYSCINRGYKYKSGKGAHKQRCEEIIDKSKQDFSGCTFGKTMVLYKTKEYNTLELLRNLALENIIPKMQAVMRGHLPREMKRRCKALNTELKKAIRKGNDLPGITKAIDAVDPTLAYLKALFPGVVPMDLEKAKALQANLREWVKIEKTLEKLLKEDPNKFYYKLKDVMDEGEALRKKKVGETKIQTELMLKAKEARENCTLGKIDAESVACLKALDLARMKKVKEDAAKYNHTTPTIQEIIKVISIIAQIDRESEAALKAIDQPKMKKILDDAQKYKHVTETIKEIKKVLGMIAEVDKEAATALEILHPPRMKAVLPEAAKFKHSTSTTTEIEKVLALPEIELVRKELEKAKEMNDEVRKIHREIRLYDMELEQEEANYGDISRYSNLRDPTEYATTMFSVILGTKKNADSMLRWTKGVTIKSLTTLSVAKAEEKNLQKMVKVISKQVRQYMNDKPVKATENQDEIAASIVQVIIAHKTQGLVEEAFYQVLKQCTEHPVGENRERGFDLLAVFLASILPSDEVLKYTLVFLKKQGCNMPPLNAIVQETKYGTQKRGDKASGVANIVQERHKGEGKSKWAVAEGGYTGPTGKE